MIKACKDPSLPPPIDVPEGPEWVEQLTTFSPASGETLVWIVFTLYPHDMLSIRVYRRIVLVLDRMAAQSTTTADLIDQAIVALEAASPLR